MTERFCIEIKPTHDIWTSWAENARYCHQIEARPCRVDELVFVCNSQPLLVSSRRVGGWTQQLQLGILTHQCRGDGHTFGNPAIAQRGCCYSR